MPALARQLASPIFIQRIYWIVLDPRPLLRSVPSLRPIKDVISRIVHQQGIDLTRLFSQHSWSFAVHAHGQLRFRLRPVNRRVRSRIQDDRGINLGHRLANRVGIGQVAPLAIQRHHCAGIRESFLQFDSQLPLRSQYQNALRRHGTAARHEKTSASLRSLPCWSFADTIASSAAIGHANAQRGIIPQHGPLAGGRIVVRHLVGEAGLIAQHRKPVTEARRNPQQPVRSRRRVQSRRAFRNQANCAADRRQHRSPIRRPRAPAFPAAE